jgi:hypothetical protein
MSRAGCRAVYERDVIKLTARGTKPLTTTVGNLQNPTLNPKLPLKLQNLKPLGAQLSRHRRKHGCKHFERGCNLKP